MLVLALLVGYSSKLTWRESLGEWEPASTIGSAVRFLEGVSGPMEERR
jgi:hypothetical protein